MGSHVLLSAVCDTTVYPICRIVVLAENEYNLRRHYETSRKGTFGVIERKLKENKIRSVKCNLQHIVAYSCRSVSCNISSGIFVANRGKRPHSYVEEERRVPEVSLSLLQCLSTHLRKNSAGACVQGSMWVSTC